MKDEKTKRDYSRPSNGYEATGTNKETNTSEDQPTSRRSLLRGAAFAGAGLGLAGLAGLPSVAHSVPSLAATSPGPAITPGDVDVLRFLAAAELLEGDLWDQYWELAAGNAAYGKALNNIEDELVTYTCDVAAYERTHVEFINAFLVANGYEPVSLDDFRTLPSTPADGAQLQGRLTNLMELTVDTSWYLKYRDAGNPDFGTVYPQFVEIKNQPVIPLSNDVSDFDMQLIANAAAFHFANSEELGSSLYPALAQKVTNLDVLRILLSIGPTEAYFFASFHQSLEGIPAISGKGMVFPNVKLNHLGGHHIPHACEFLHAGLPQCCVIRPISTKQAGAVHQITAGTNAGLFKGQSKQFFHTLMSLAVKADAAQRSL